jgi:membrane protease YdiL (CAAX protease family)
VTRARATAVLEIIICSGIPTQNFIAALLVHAGLVAPASAGQWSVGFVASVLLPDTAILVALMVLFTRGHGESVRALWLGPRPWTREALLGIALVPIVFLLVAAVLTAVRLAAPWLHNVPENPLERLAQQGRFESLLFGIVVIVGGGFREELQRAFMLRRFEDHLGGRTAGLILLSAAFGLGHFEQGWDAVVTTGVIGAFWAILYLWRRSSVAPIVSHAGFNALEVLRVALFSI